MRNHRKRTTRRLLGVSLTLMVTAGCGSESHAYAIASDALVQLHLTDTPADHLASARVWVSRIYLLPSLTHGLRAEPVELLGEEAVREFDLLELRGGESMALTAPRRIPPRDYSEMRVVIDSARLELEPGLTFRDGGSHRTVLPVEQDVRVQLARPLAAESGDDVQVTLDLDVNESFPLRLQRDGVAATPRRFSPMLREKGRSRSGSAPPVGGG